MNFLLIRTWYMIVLMMAFHIMCNYFSETTQGISIKTRIIETLALHEFLNSLTKVLCKLDGIIVTNSQLETKKFEVFLRATFELIDAFVVIGRL